MTLKQGAQTDSKWKHNAVRHNKHMPKTQKKFHLIISDYNMFEVTKLVVGPANLLSNSDLSAKILYYLEQLGLILVQYMLGERAYLWGYIHRLVYFVISAWTQRENHSTATTIPSIQNGTAAGAIILHNVYILYTLHNTEWAKNKWHLSGCQKKFFGEIDGNIVLFMTPRRHCLKLWILVYFA